MPHNLTLPDLLAIRRLLRAGVRHTEIARRMNFAVGTITRIAADRKLRRRRMELLDEHDLPEDDPPPEYVARQLRRCPGCGGMVYLWPCLACRLIEAPVSREGEAPAEPLAAPQDGETEGRSDGEMTASVPSLRLSVPLSLCPSVSLSDQLDVSHAT